MAKSRPKTPVVTAEPKRIVKKFLCICQGGNVRSAGLAFILKYHGGQDAIAASTFSNSPETLTMLCDWADYIILMAQDVLATMPPGVLAKRRYALVDVGPDRYGSPFHPELQGMLMPVVQQWAANDWDLNAKPQTKATT